MLGHLYFFFLRNQAKCLILAILLCFSVVMLTNAWESQQIADRAKHEAPPAMSYSEIAQAEQLPWRPIEVTECRVGTGMSRPLAIGNTPYIWIPVLPKSSPDDEDGRAIRLIARFPAMQLPNVPELLTRTSLQGLCRGDQFITQEAYEDLLKFYPALNMKKCRILSIDSAEVVDRKLKENANETNAFAWLCFVLSMLMVGWMAYALKEPRHARLPKLSAAGHRKPSTRRRLVSDRMAELQQGQVVESAQWKLSVDGLSWTKGTVTTSLNLTEISSMQVDDSGLWIWKQKVVSPFAFFSKKASDTELLSELLQQLLPHLCRASAADEAAWKERRIQSPRSRWRSQAVTTDTDPQAPFDPYAAIKSETSAPLPSLKLDDPAIGKLGKFITEFRQPNALIGLGLFIAVGWVLTVVIPEFGYELRTSSVIAISITLGIAIAAGGMEWISWGQHRLLQFENGFIHRRFGRNRVVPFDDLLGCSLSREHRSLNNQYIGTSFWIRLETKGRQVCRFSGYYHEGSVLETDVEEFIEEVVAAVAENLRQQLKAQGAVPWTNRMVFYPDHLEISGVFNQASVPYAEVSSATFHEGVLHVMYGPEQRLVKLPPATCNAAPGAALLDLMRATCC